MARNAASFDEPALGIAHGQVDGDRVVVTCGLTAGERIVASGTFLIDSESRFQLVAAGLTAAAEKDPVCGMDVEPSTAKHKIQHKSKTYYFCSETCRKNFEAALAKYLEGKTSIAQGGRHDRQDHRILGE